MEWQENALFFYTTINTAACALLYHNDYTHTDPHPHNPPSTTHTHTHPLSLRQTPGLAGHSLTWFVLPLRLEFLGMPGLMTCYS